ncbi:carboxylesterase family protein [Paracoccus sp. (in: a-proteobacteria)]|uniref:carboxylesterase family protein n=1 Tax=Paracoccus sp. TaxID=267 RepID=UPI003A8C6CDD
MKHNPTEKNGTATRLAIPVLLTAIMLPWTKPVWALDMAYAPGVLQTTQDGQVSGSEINDGKTLHWQGIPYARPPVGDLRWKAPQPPEPRSDVFDATGEAPLCPQMGADGAAGAEDCLTLDIFRPNTEETGLPVLVYIHGGNNQGGTSREINAEEMALSANAVVVSLNYRLGLLGFNALPALETGNAEEDSGNYTLLDFARSLDWLKENVAAFGGDGENITVSGFSAGGRDVMALLISPIFAGKFQKAISFSGGMTLADEGASARLIAGAIAPLVVADGVKPTETEATDWLLSSEPDVRDYLYGLPAERLAGLMTNAGIRMAVFPHLYNDGAVLPNEGYATTAYNSVPLIMVTGSKEFSLFARGASEFGALDDDQLLAEPGMLAEYAFTIDHGSDLYTLFNAEQSAEIMFASYHAPIYTMRFAWGGDESIVGERMARLYGSFHGVWVPFFTARTTGFSATFPEAFDNMGAKDLTSQVGAYVKNFIRDGDPNGEGLVTWKPWDSATSGPTQLVLDADMDKASIVQSEERTRYDDLLAAIESDDSIPQEQKAQQIADVLAGRWFSYGLDRHFDNQNLWVGVQ